MTQFPVRRYVHGSPTTALLSGSDHKFVRGRRSRLALLGLPHSAAPGRDQAERQALRPAGFQQPYWLGDALKLHLPQLDEGHTLGRRPGNVDAGRCAVRDRYGPTAVNRSTTRLGCRRGLP